MESFSPARHPSSVKSPTTSPSKRKPYRRTKRPKNYNDKSTITTCTPTAVETPGNVYDAVLGEAEDLLRAASDAQSLGRLKMASNYLLLLHARLVGLGKKFDRAKTAPPSMSEESTMKPKKLDLSPERPHKRKGPTLAVGDPAPQTPVKKPYEPPPSNSISEAALNQLTNYLPSNIELDQAMVEHLARAAAELHQKRTGKRTADEGLLNSPAMNTEEVFHYNKEIQSKDKGSGSNPSSNNNNTKRQNGSVAWTDDEHDRFQEAVEKVGTDNPEEIAKLMGSRNEAQVRAYLKNVSDLEKGNAAMEEEMLDDTPRKRGGRGRKPPTTAMNTVPNANLDAKSMLQGTFFGL